MSEIVGLPKDWLIKLTAAALGKIKLSKADEAQAADLLARLLPISHKASLDKPTGTAEVIDIDAEIHKASSVSASPSWTVSRPAQNQMSGSSEFQFDG